MSEFLSYIFIELHVIKKSAQITSVILMRFSVFS